MSLGLISCLTLSGCATAGSGALPQGGDMSMAQIYKQETGLAQYQNIQGEMHHLSDARKRLYHGVPVRYQRMSAVLRLDEKEHFKLLPNPQVGLYVEPHFVHGDGESEPVPGYNTAFFLYKKNHFALPSENY